MCSANHKQNILMIFETRKDFDYPVLEYQKYKQAFEQNTLAKEIALAYGKTLKEVKELSSDPDHGGKITLSSLLVTMVAFSLEENGILECTVKRGPAQTDLEDGWGRKWDVKTPPHIEGIGFNEESAIHSILKKLNEFPDGNVGILLDVSFIQKKNYLELQKDLKDRLNDNQKFLVRQVVVKGVLF